MSRTVTLKVWELVFVLFVTLTLGDILKAIVKGMLQ